MKIRTLIIIVILVALIAAGGYFVYQQQVRNAKAAATNLQTATISRGDLAATVSGAGNLYAPQQTNLNFQLAGAPITKINVQVGDKVKAGDVLAQADDSDLQFSLRSAQAQLMSAQASLEKLKQPALDVDVAAAQAQVASAQTAYQVAVTKSQHGGDQLAAAKATLDNAKAALDQAQAAYDKIAWRSDVGASSQALTLQQATNTYKSALASYNLATTDVNDSGVKSAAQQLASAQASLAKLIQPPTPQDLAQAQASVDSAQVSVDQAKRKLLQAQIVAPFSGTVAAVNYVIGQLSPSGSSSAVITLVNLDDMQTQVTVSEVDIAKVKADQSVNLTFDALSRQTFPGKIISISPVGTVTSGVVNYVVTIALTKTDPSVKPGMTAEASITVAQRANVLIAPNRAVKTQGNQRIMTILFEGKQVPLLIQTGLNNDTNTEIQSATTLDGQAVTLQDGDTVVLNPTTTSTNNFRGPGGAIIGGFGRPGD